MTKTRLVVICLVGVLVPLSGAFATASTSSEVSSTLSAPTLSPMLPNGTLVVPPSASFASGDYHSSLSVTLTAAGSHAIYYTLNGTGDPVCATGTAYTSALTINSATTLKAVACYSDDNSVSSTIAPYAYTFSCSPATVSNGSFSSYSSGCLISCYSGYTPSGGSCVASGSSGSGGSGGGGGSYSNPYTITINGGATTTASANVTLVLTSLGGMNWVWISNDPSFATSTGTGWIPFQATYPWTLASGPGNKTVYAEFGSASNTVAFAGSAQASITVVGGGTGGTTGSGGSGGTSGTSRASQLQLLNMLIAELRLLLQQALAQGITLPPGVAAYLNAGSATSTLSAITRDLTIGSIGTDVSALQAFLILQNKGPAASALAAVGATGHFGLLTQAALAEYQAAVEITPPTGYFGPRTRAYLQSIGY